MLNRDAKAAASSLGHRFAIIYNRWHVTLRQIIVYNTSISRLVLVWLINVFLLWVSDGWSPMFWHFAFWIPLDFITEICLHYLKLLWLVSGLLK